MTLTNDETMAEMDEHGEACTAFCKQAKEKVIGYLFKMMKLSESSLLSY